MAYSKRPMRRSALIGPWGVGAMVPFPNDESLMVTGLDAWRYQNEQPFVIRDERLVKRLGVKELRWPPDFRERNADPVNCNIKIPTVRFPRWHYCPFCGSMEKTTYYRESLPECDQFQWPNGRVCSSQGKFRRKMIPERFVVVCPEGHIDDFPIAAGILRDHFERVNSSRVNGELNRFLIDYIADMNHVDKDRLYQAFIDEENQREGAIEITEDMTEDEYRLEEYKVLIKNSGNDVEDFHSINYLIENYNPVIRKYFKSISLVPKLKETRAFVGFSRLDAPNRRVSESKKELRLGNEEWLPAIEVYGEGIFFEFNEEKLTEWANKPNVKERIDILNRSYHNAKFGINDSGNLRPEFILIHTFSHLLINQLSFDCGYGSSSIRERIYCEKTSNDLKMYGLLLYTASGDSEGSLGGLVRQGETGRIEDTILSAMENASWCTSDPVCIQSAGQGPESLNLAACHNCTLLPETCCEVGNRLLDRGTVVGTLSDKQIGFFADIIHAEGE